MCLEGIVHTSRLEDDFTVRIHDVASAKDFFEAPGNVQEYVRVGAVHVPFAIGKMVIERSFGRLRRVKQFGHANG